jgi:hypothetical protein
MAPERVRVDVKEFVFPNLGFTPILLSQSTMDCFQPSYLLHCTAGLGSFPELRAHPPPGMSLVPWFVDRSTYKR